MFQKAREHLAGLQAALDFVSKAKNPLELAKALAPAGLFRPEVLNAGGSAAAGDAKLAQHLKRLHNRLKAEALDDQGRVNYAALGASGAYADLQTAARGLAGVRPADFTNNERLAFWINLYNVLTIHGVIAKSVRKSVLEYPSFFRSVAYNVADQTLTLDAIEHGILRLNAPHPASKQRLFAAGDKRLAWRPGKLDPRLHCALVCAGASCPPVAFYDSDKIDDQLDLAAASFVSASTRLQDDAIYTSMIFKWYADDFKEAGGVRAFLLKHIETARKNDFRKALSAGAELRYDRYDWSLNSA